VLVNPNNPISKLGLQQIQVAAEAIGLDLRVLNASDSHQIDMAPTVEVRSGIGSIQR
jgi:hypothetical protein